MNSIFIKLIFLFNLVFTISLFGFSQAQNQIFINDSAHLIKSGCIYETEVLSIRKMRTGFGFFLKVNIGENQDAYCFVVSNVIECQNLNKTQFNYIRSGDKLKLVLIDYFNDELVLSIENKRIYDVLLGEDKVVIPAGVYGFGFSRIFVSPNIMSRYYCEDIPDKSIFLESTNIPIKLNSTILQFINCISFDKEFEKVSNYADTMRLRKSLLSTSFPYLVVSPGHSYNTKKNKAYKKTYKNIDWESYGIKTANFIDFFKGALKENYQLPLTDYDESCFIKELNIRILYLYENITTLEVKWSIQNINYIAVLTLMEDDGSYKVIGIVFR
jgi:hypothetical protein